jgi:hypothetical protein
MTMIEIAGLGGAQLARNVGRAHGTLLGDEQFKPELDVTGLWIIGVTRARR